jgi:FkbM family methyltransferase
MDVKNAARKALGPAGVKFVKRLLRRDHLSEVEVVADVILRGAANGIMFDVGAHKGYELEHFANRGWSVVAFEPDNENRKVLQERFGNNAKVKIDSRAVSEKIEKGLAFFSSDISTGISGLLAFHDSHHETQQVDTTTIAEAMTDYAIDHIDFLKIDIEGYDFFAIKGIDWDRNPPDVILCEYENRKTIKLGYTVYDLVAYLREHGYGVTISEWLPIVEYGRTHKWKRFTDDVSALDPNGWGNLIAYKPIPRLEDLHASRLPAIAKRLFG